MKNKIFTLIILLTSVHAMGSELGVPINQSKTGYSNQYSFKEVKYGKLRSHWSGISFGYNGLITNLGDFHKPSGAEFMKQEGNSLTFNLNFFDIEIVSTRPFSIVSGIGMEFNTFRFSNDISIRRDENGMIVPNMYYQEQGISIQKTKLSTNYFVIPLLAEFRFGECAKRSFYIHGGMMGGWLFNGHTKVKYTSGKSTEKDKNRNLALNKFRYGYTIGLGWGNFGIFARYYPESIFKSAYGPDVKQISLGISFNASKKH